MEQPQALAGEEPFAPAPDRVGVSGVSVEADQAGEAERSGVRATAAVRRWQAGAPGDFPYAEVIAHYRAVGRLGASPALVQTLRDLADIPSQDGTLRAWLPLTFDQEDGDYGSYLGLGLFSHLIDPGGDQVADALFAGTVAELVVTEAVALRHRPGDRVQRGRAMATLHALSRIDGLCPGTELRSPAGVAELASDRHIDGGLLAERALQIGLEMLEQLPDEVRSTVEISYLPLTKVHDEHMFIRTLQSFELLYGQVAGHVRRGTEELSDGATDHAVAELLLATTRVLATSALYRVVTSMPRDAFAIIRDNSMGRSAIQSPGFRLIEILSGPRAAVVAGERVPLPEAAAPSLQQVLESGPAEPRIIAAMTELDAAWRAHKRTHWGITLKIIGDVPGTGGTSGAGYLKVAADLPLFPILEYWRNIGRSS